MPTLEALHAFLANRRALNRSPHTLDWYRRLLGKFADRCPELPMEPEPLEDFIGGIDGEPETRHGYYRALRALYRFVCRRRRLPNPMEMIDPPRCPRKIMPTLEPRQMMELLNMAAGARDRALLSLYLDNGARVGEVVGLRKQDIGDSTIRVSGKTGQREIPISEETRRLLLAVISADGKSEYVFLGRQGKPLTRHGVYWIVRGYMMKAGIQRPKVGSHRLRHAFGRGYLVNGGDIRSLQEIMGHADIRTTQKYASLNLADLIAKHHMFTTLRSARVAAQESFFNTDQAIKEACTILEGKAPLLAEPGNRSWCVR
jgi:site-specific recombinase XerD